MIGSCSIFGHPPVLNFPKQPPCLAYLHHKKSWQKLLLNRSPQRMHRLNLLDCRDVPMKIAILRSVPIFGQTHIRLLLTYPIHIPMHIPILVGLYPYQMVRIPILFGDIPIGWFSIPFNPIIHSNLISCQSPSIHPIRSPMIHQPTNQPTNQLTTWWFIPLSKWIITLVINGISGGNVHL